MPFEASMRRNDRLTRSTWEIFSNPQDAATPTGLFVSQKRALLAQIDPPDSEPRQLDFIYGLLRVNIRDRIPRSSFSTFADLLKLTREAEAIIAERSNQRANFATTTSNNGKPRNRPKCEFCDNFGHVVSECGKKVCAANKKTTYNSAKPSTNTPSSISCFGCGQPGVLRRNCTRCPKSTSAPKPSQAAAPPLEFCILDLQLPERPAVEISVGTVNGSAFLDSGARTSLASAQLCERFSKFHSK
jgi:hypothetical protein